MCCGGLQKAEPPRLRQSGASSAFPLLYSRGRRRICAIPARFWPASKTRDANPRWRSGPHNADGSATPRPSSRAIFPAAAAALWTKTSVPRPTATTRPFWCGINGRARRSDHPNRVNEAVRIPVRQPHPCEHKSAGVLRHLAGAQNRLFPSDGRKRCVPRWSLRPHWPPAPPR